MAATPVDAKGNPLTRDAFVSGFQVFRPAVSVASPDDNTQEIDLRTIGLQTQATMEEELAELCGPTSEPCSILVRSA